MAKLLLTKVFFYFMFPFLVVLTFKFLFPLLIVVVFCYFCLFVYFTHFFAYKMNQVTFITKPQSPVESTKIDSDNKSNGELKYPTCILSPVGLI